MKKVIGIIKCKENIVDSKILYELLKTTGCSVSIISFEDLNREHINKSKENIDVLIIEIDLDYIEEVSRMDLSIDIIIDVDMTLDKQEECICKKKKLISNLRQNDLLIVNADNADTIRLSSTNDKPTVMTYGINGKSSITVSSLNFDDDRTKFNLCLQRKITTICGSQIEQFEHNVDMSLMSMESLYTIIAFISASLYFGIDIEDIVETLFNIN